MSAPKREQLYFESIKEDRGAYFVEYQPPFGDNPFANLSLVYSGQFDLSEVGTGDTEWDANVGARILWKLSNMLVANNN